jgi:hydrogenase-4 component F
MIVLLFLTPIVLATLCLAIRNKIANRCAMLAYSALLLVSAFFICSGNLLFILPDEISVYFSFDPLSKLFFAILAIVGFAVVLYSFSYLAKKGFDRTRDTLYSVFLILFTASMSAGILASHLAFAWVFIEATTLFGAVLIYTERERTALEAVWKYLFICSIGVSFSFIGIILLSMSGTVGTSLFFSDLVAGAKGMNPFLLKLSFAFILVGFGTKMGLSPVHAWLPDAHSEAPSPVSALLSGVLLNVSAIVIIRFTMIMDAAGLRTFAGTLLIVMGIISLLVSASYILTSTNYKRMLAYSSIENMGVVAIGIGIGGGAIFASLLQIVVHSFAKSGLFLTSGNIYALYGSKQIEHSKELVKYDRFTAYLWLLGFLALAGFPPFGSFIAKFFLAKALVSDGYMYLFIPVFLILVVVIAGMGSRVMKMAFEKNPSVEIHGKKGGFLSYAPQAILLLILILLGLWIPEPVRDLLERARDFIVSAGVYG